MSKGKNIKVSIKPSLTNLPTGTVTENCSVSKPDSDHLVRAMMLLKEAQDGMNVIIGGEGPYEDRINGVFFKGFEGGESTRFLLSQWNELVNKLKEELSDGTR